MSKIFYDGKDTSLVLMANQSCVSMILQTTGMPEPTGFDMLDRESVTAMRDFLTQWLYANEMEN